MNNLRKKGNKFIFYPLDFNWKKHDYVQRMIKIFKHFDHIIFNSIKHKNLFNIKSSSVIYHEYDIRFKNTNKKRTDIIQYCGQKGKSSLEPKIYEQYNIKHIESPLSCALPCIHIDYVKKKTGRSSRYYNVHTSTKLSTSLYLNSVFICNRIPVYEEILGKEYELFINEDMSNLNDIIEKAKKIILDENKYQEYLKKTKSAKDLLSPDNIQNEFLKIEIK
jgi:hypothetical protein